MTNISFSRFEGVRYTFKQNKGCMQNKHRHHRYRTIQEAKDKCSHDSNCGGVYVGLCDPGEGVYLCYKGYDYDYSSYSCVYDKTSGTVK